jgi:hypothetical protein
VNPVLSNQDRLVIAALERRFAERDPALARAFDALGSFEALDAQRAPRANVTTRIATMLVRVACGSLILGSIVLLIMALRHGDTTASLLLVITTWPLNMFLLVVMIAI